MPLVRASDCHSVIREDAEAQDIMLVHQAPVDFGPDQKRG